MRVVCVDPGHTTGYAVIVGENGTDWNIEDMGIIVGIKQTIEKILEFRPDIVVCESFRLHTKDAKAVSVQDPELHSAQIIGALKYAVPEYLVFQTPSEKVTWEFARQIFPKNGNPHIQDALCHAVKFILSRKPKPKVNSGPPLT
jgi:hypothetical protein